MKLAITLAIIAVLLGCGCGYVAGYTSGYSDGGIYAASVAEREMVKFQDQCVAGMRILREACVSNIDGIAKAQGK